MVGDNNSFTIHAVSKSGLNVSGISVEVVITGPGNVPVTSYVRNRRVGVFDVSYVPSSPGDHVIEVKIDGQQISGSPYFTTFEPYQKENKSRPNSIAAASSFQGSRPTSAIKMKRVSSASAVVCPSLPFLIFFVTFLTNFSQTRDREDFAMPSQSEDSLPLLGKKWSNLAEKDGSEGFLSFLFLFYFYLF